MNQRTKSHPTITSSPQTRIKHDGVGIFLPTDSAASDRQALALAAHCQPIAFKSTPVQSNPKERAMAVIAFTNPRPSRARPQGASTKTTCDSSTKKFDVSCSSCNLRELCLPTGMNPEEMRRVEQVVYARRRVHRGEALFHAGDSLESPA